MERSHWVSWLLLAAALYLLNLALSFHNVWPTPWIEDRHELSVEIALLILGLVLWTELRGSPPGRGLMVVLAIVLTLLAIGRYAEVTAPALYGRTVNLYWDAQHLPKVAAMLVEVAPPWLVAGATLGLMLLLGLVFALILWALGRVRLGLSESRPRRVMGAVAGGFAALYLAGSLGEPLRAPVKYAKPVSQTYAAQTAFLVDALAHDGAARQLPDSPAVKSDLGMARGAHVVVLFLESYGATAYDRADLAPVIDPARALVEAAAADTGRGAVSAFVRSPTFAGASWLAHASLLSGIEVDDSSTYKLLLTQERDTLAHRFSRLGHRAVAVMPGLRKDWPEGAFYGFHAILGAKALNYGGPDFGWWRIPDQFALARLDALELATGEGPPRFVVFPTISTHLPFRPTPPYQPDWPRLLGSNPYDGEVFARAVAKTPDWLDLGASYADALAYAFSYLAGYLRLRAQADLILIVLGDHQPAASVSGEGASREVPVHLITGRTEILDRLAAAGFATGLTPKRPALGDMHELYGLLLRALDTGRSDVTGFDTPGVDVAGTTAQFGALHQAAHPVGVDPAR